MSYHLEAREWIPRVLRGFAWTAGVGLAGLLWLILAAPGAAADVDPTGAFTTNVPITVPAFHGLEPRLALTYSSAGGDGWLGVGWTVQGLSSINRESSDHGLPRWDDGTDRYTVDGEELVPCAQVAAGASPGCDHVAAGTTGYAATVEGFQRIGLTSNSDGGTWTIRHTDGVVDTYTPSVHTGHGVMTWQLASRADLNGNTVTYDWAPTQNGQAGMLKAIRYGGGQPGTPPDVEIRFVTEQRPDQLTVAVGDGLITNPTRLHAIEEYAGGTVIRSYALRYELRPDGRSMLAGVQQVGSDGATATPETTFTLGCCDPLGPWLPRTPDTLAGWSDAWPANPDPQHGWDTVFNGGPQGQVPWSPSGIPDPRRHTLSGDFNGDGRIDSVIVMAGAYQGHAPWNAPWSAAITTQIAQPGGGFHSATAEFTWATPSGEGSWASDATVHAGDVNGDGRTDIVIVFDTPQRNTPPNNPNHGPARAYAAVLTADQNGTITQAPNTEPPNNGLQLLPMTMPDPMTFDRGGGQFMLADVSGDGRADLISVTAPNGTSCEKSVVQFGLGTAAADDADAPTFDFGPQTAACGLFDLSVPTGSVSNLQTADLNGDNKADIVEVDSAGHDAHVISGIAVTGNRFTFTDTPIHQGWESQFDQAGDTGSYAVTPFRPLWIDEDGDGRSDLVVLGATQYATDTPVQAVTFRSLGNGAFAPAVTGSTPLTTGDIADYYVRPDVKTTLVAAGADVLPAHLNGDSAEDIVAVGGDRHADDRTFTVRRLLAQPDGSFTGLPATSLDWSSSCPSTTKYCWGGGWSCPNGDNCRQGSPATLTGDLDGDGFDDVIVEHPDLQAHVLAVSTDLSAASPTADGAIRADTNGDGTPDLVAVIPTSDEADPAPVRQPGVQVRVLRTVSGGGFTALSPVTVGLPNLHLLRRGWRAADVNCDGRDDLLNTDGGITVLLATGDNTWEAHQSADQLGPAVQVADALGTGCAQLVAPGLVVNGARTVDVLQYRTLSSIWQVQHFRFGADADPALRDPFGWRVAAVAGGRAAALVHVNTGTGRVDTLFFSGTGRDVADSVPQFLDSGADDSAWVPALINGDGAMDMARVVIGDQGHLVVQTLTSHGDGHYTAAANSPSTVTGDGPNDIGTAGWVPVTLAPAAPAALVRVFNRGSDLIVQTLTASVDGTSWTLENKRPDSAPAVPSTAWQVGQIDFGEAGILRPELDSSGALVISSWDAHSPKDLVFGVSNGLGAHTEIDYNSPMAVAVSARVPDDECQVPGGALTGVLVYAVHTTVNQPRTDLAPAASYTVKAGDSLFSIAQATLGDGDKWPSIFDLNKGHPQRDGQALDDPGVLQPGWILQLPTAAAPSIDPPGVVTDDSSISYGCPRYSSQQARFLGWTDSRTTHNPASVTYGGFGASRPGSEEHVTRAIDAASGIVRVIEDDSSAVINGYTVITHRTRNEPEPIGDSAPFRDQLKKTTGGNCTHKVCALSTTTLTYDDYGNVKEKKDVAAGSGRSRDTTIEYVHDDARWLHNRPRLSIVSDPDHPKVTARATMTCYDKDPSTDCLQLPSSGPGLPPLPGLPTSTRVWDGKGQVTDGTNYPKVGGADYDQWGNRTTVSDARGNTTTTTFDPVLHLYPISVCSALNQCTTAPEWDRRADAPTSAIDPNGATTTTGFDALGRVHEVTGPSGVHTVTDYSTDPATGTTELVTTDAPGVPATWVRTVTDGLGHPYRVERPGGDGSRVTVTGTVYLDATLPAVTIGPHYSDQPATSYDTTTYDSQGRPTAVTHPDHSSSSSIYDITDDEHEQVTGTDETGHTTTHFTDGWGALSRVDQTSVEHPGTPATTRYAYDYAGDLTGITDSHNNIVSYDWNPLGQQTAEHDPDRGTSSYLYDLAGNLIDSTDARGSTVHYTYDRLNRTETKTDKVTGAVTTWTYDETTGHGPAVGRLTTVTDPTSAAGCANNMARSVVYDQVGNITQDTRCVTGTTGTITTDHDPLGRPTTLTYPDHLKVGYSYDSLGRLSGVDGYVTGIRYDAADRAQTIRYANNTVSNTGYDPQQGWLTNQTLTPAMGKTDTLLFDAAYTHDFAGVVSGTTSSSHKQHETYGYDPLGQLTTITDTSTGQITQQMQYDDIGNITSNSQFGGYHYDSAQPCTAVDSCTGTRAQVHAVSTAGNTSYQYDPAGNTVGSVTPSGTRHYTWNTEGLLEQLDDATAGTIHNTYDPDGTRVRQDTPTGAAIYLAGLADYDTTTGTWTDYIAAGGRLIASRTADHTSWYTLDRQGSTRALTDEKGAVTATATYTPWGQPASSGDTGPIGYTGHRQLGDTTLIDMAARDYDPTLARMLTPDSIIPNPADPQALNRYAYTYNNPVNYTDPTGHEPVQGPNWWNEFVQASEAVRAIGPAGIINYNILNNDLNRLEDIYGTQTDRTLIWVWVPSPTPTATSAGNRGSGGGGFGIFGVAARYAAQTAMGAGIGDAKVTEDPQQDGSGATATTTQSSDDTAVPELCPPAVPCFVENVEVVGNPEDPSLAVTNGVLASMGFSWSGSPESPPPRPLSSVERVMLYNMGAWLGVTGGGLLSGMLGSSGVGTLSGGLLRVAQWQWYKGLNALVRPLVPAGTTLAAWGKTIWGSTPTDALSQIGARTAEQLTAIGLNTYNSAILRDFFEAASLLQKGGLAAPARAELMKHILQVLSGG